MPSGTSAAEPDRTDDAPIRTVLGFGGVAERDDVRLPRDLEGSRWPPEFPLVLCLVKSVPARQRHTALARRAEVCPYALVRQAGASGLHAGSDAGARETR
jgi:hypothetical protein